MHDDCLEAGVAAPSIDDSLGMMLLPFVLSVIAGTADVIAFLGLGGLFTAHITGNLVILAARIVARNQAPLAHLIAVPVFVVILAATRLLVAGLVRISLKGAPSTAVMTTNVTLFALAVVEILLRRNTSGGARARSHAEHTWPAIAGFLLGCALGAACESAFGLRSLVLPAGLALFALTLGSICRPA